MRLVVTVMLSVVLAGVAQGPAGAEEATEPVPAAPYNAQMFDGVDGILVTWNPHPDGTVTGYWVQRSTSYDGTYEDLAWTPAGSPTRYLDPVAGGELWAYRVVAVNAVGRSAPALIGSIRVPVVTTEAGTVNAFSVVGSQSDASAGGVFFGAPNDTVTLAPQTVPNSFTIRGTSGAGSPQGARDASLTVSTMYNNRRIKPGTYSTSSITGVRVSLCPSGQLVVHESAFLADGTPLVFSASFKGCGWGSAEFRWHAHEPIAKALTTGQNRVVFGDVQVGQSAAQVITVYNAGSAAQQLGAVTLADLNVDIALAKNFAITADTCSATALPAGGSCEVEVTAAPQVVDRVYANLRIVDESPYGKREVFVEGWGVDRPAPPVLDAVGNYRAIGLSWAAVTGGSHAPATGYTVLRGATAQSLKPYATVTGSYFRDDDVTVGTTYWYSVVARNALGEGRRSDAKSAVPVPTGILVATNAARGTTSSIFDIAALNSSGRATRVTDGGGNHDTPAVSPDGSMTAWTSDSGRPGDYDLWIRRGTSAPVKLTTDAATSDAEPAFSPDGKRIAFSRSTSGGSSVWTVPSAGGTPVQVPINGAAGSPTWSPNGRLLAVAHLTAASGPSTSAIMVTTLDGKVQRPVAGTTADGAKFLSVNPSWAPNGARISFVRLTPEGISNLMWIPAAGGSLRSLTDYRTTTVQRQQWAPAGDRIVFSGLVGDSFDTLWSIPAAGGAPTAVAGPRLFVLASPAVAEPVAPYTPGPVPASATALKVVPSTTSMKLSWTAPAGAGWVVVRRSAAGGSAPTGPERGTAVYLGTGSSVTVNGLTMGKDYAFSVFTMSAVGDAGPAAVVTARTADTQAPETKIVSGPPSVGKDRTPSFSFGANESGVAFTCSLDGKAWVACPSAWTAPSQKDGKHTLRVRAKDKAGNVDPTPATASFRVDTRAPDTVLVSGPGSNTRDRTPSFTFRSHDSGARFSCRIGSGKWRTCTSTWTSASLKVGSHTFEVRATDSVGNVDPTPARHRFRVS